MAQYIDKAALVAEIEKRKQRNHKKCTPEGSGAYYEDGFILDIINTLEVKEVDLNATDKQERQQWIDKACDAYCKDCEYVGCDRFECLALEKFRKLMEE